PATSPSTCAPPRTSARSAGGSTSGSPRWRSRSRRSATSSTSTPSASSSCPSSRRTGGRRRSGGSSTTATGRPWRRGPPPGIERSRFSVVLLDEYQDTSQAQLVLLKSLFGGGHPVTAVGDPCQSIYGWRGASAGNLLRFAHDFPLRPGGPGGRPVPAPVVQLS